MSCFHLFPYFGGYFWPRNRVASHCLLLQQPVFARKAYFSPIFIAQAVLSSRIGWAHLLPASQMKVFEKRARFPHFLFHRLFSVQDRVGAPIAASTSRFARKWFVLAYFPFSPGCFGSGIGGRPIACSYRQPAIVRKWLFSPIFSILSLFLAQA